MTPFVSDAPSRRLPGALGRFVSTAEARPWVWLTAAGFTGGYFVMPNGWVQLCWLAAGLVMISASGSSGWVAKAWTGDPWLRAMSLLLVGVVVTSGLTSQGQVVDFWRMVEWTSGAGLLWLMCALWWTVGLARQGGDRLGVATVVAAVVGALAGLMNLAPHLLGQYLGHRLENPLVHGGLNPVCTALTLGLGAVWASVRSTETECVRERRLWLAAQFVVMLACLFTLSRGGFLAMGAAQGALLWVKGGRFVWRTLSVSVLAVMVFVMVGTLRTAVDAPAGTMPVAMGKLGQGPLGRMIARGDSSRLEIYQAGLSALQTPMDRVLGRGLWMDDDCWRCGLGSNPNHLHSVFVAALVQAGWVGLAGLVLCLAMGFRRLLWLARRGEGTWLVLACFGLAGLVFDGQSPFSLTTMPRFEALILWMPLALGSAAYVRARQKEKPTVM